MDEDNDDRYDAGNILMMNSMFNNLYLACELSLRKKLVASS